MESSTIYLIFGLFALLFILFIEVFQLIGIIDYQYEFTKTSKFMRNYRFYDTLVICSEIFVLIFFILAKISFFVTFFLSMVVFADLYTHMKYKSNHTDYMEIQKNMYNVKVYGVFKLVVFAVSVSIALVKLLKLL